MNILEKITNIAENTGIIIVELVASPVLDDVSEHMMHDFKKIFIKDFKDSKSIVEELEENILRIREKMFSHKNKRDLK